MSEKNSLKWSNLLAKVTKKNGRWKTDTRTKDSHTECANESKYIIHGSAFAAHVALEIFKGFVLGNGLIFI